VVCDYDPITRWQSGAQRNATRIKMHWAASGPLPLPRIVSAIDNDLDWILFEHFSALSTVLSVRPDQSNPFQGNAFYIRYYTI
jgi:hypothetical protein